MVNRGVWDRVFEVLCVRGHKDTALVRLGGPRNDERPHPHPRTGVGAGLRRARVRRVGSSIIRRMHLARLPDELTALPPWSKNKLRQLGECLRDEVEPGDGLPEYDDVLLWYDGIATATQRVIRSLDWDGILGAGRTFEVTSRAKTRDTLTAKLLRDRGHPLSSVQDVAGVRFEAEMTLSEQDKASAAIAQALGCESSDGVHDLRADPHSGYRAVHVWARLPAGRVEVQVRTHLQGQWANAYEAFADIVGRGVRYGETHSNPTTASLAQELQELSVARGADLERLRDRAALGDTTIEALMTELDSRRHAIALRKRPWLRFRLWRARLALAKTKRQQVYIHKTQSELEAEYSRSLGDIEDVCRRAKARGGSTWPVS